MIISEEIEKNKLDLKSRPIPCYFLCDSDTITYCNYQKIYSEKYSDGKTYTIWPGNICPEKT